MARFNIVIIQPRGYPHSACFEEVAETLAYGLQALGHDAKLSRNFFSQTRWNIVFGAHLLDSGCVLPERSVVYNLEQYRAPAFDAAAHVPGYSAWWDYSAENILHCPVDHWAKYSKIVPIGYVPELTRIKPREQDIDVLFYGSINERRKKILEDCVNAGLRVQAVFNVYGRERDELISRSKVVLNVHFYESKIFEIVRCSYLLANRKCVVSEESNEMDADLKGAVVEVPYPELVDTCKFYVEHRFAREDWEQEGFELMSKRDEREILKAALAGVDWEIGELARQE